MKVQNPSQKQNVLITDFTEFHRFAFFTEDGQFHAKYFGREILNYGGFYIDYIILLRKVTTRPIAEAVIAIRQGRPWPTQTRAWPTQTKFCPTYTTPVARPKICLALWLAYPYENS